MLGKKDGYAEDAFLWTRHSSRRFQQRNNLGVDQGEEKKSSSSIITYERHREVDRTENGSCNDINSRSRSLA